MEFQNNYAPLNAINSREFITCPIITKALANVLQNPNLEKTNFELTWKS